MNIGKPIPSEIKQRMDALVDFLLNFYGPMPYIIVFGILLACGLGVPIPEDITLVVGGILAYYGLCNLWIMIAVCLAGVMIGDSLVFWLGQKYGRLLTKKWFFHKVLPDERLEQVQTWFQKYGNKLIFAARFMPGFRAPIFLFDGLAALLSVPAIVGAVYRFGDQIEGVISWVRRFEYGILTAVLLIVLLAVGKWYGTHRKARGGVE
jgi:membrane protein DedA with SNARE-associated domain